MMAKSKAPQIFLLKLKPVTIWNSLHEHDKTEMKTVESFEKHYIYSFITVILFYKNTLKCK